MDKAVNQEERAYRAWDVLIEAARNNDTITYGELGDKLNVHHRTCRYFLDHIQNYCLNEKLPPLTIIVVNQRGEVGQGFTAWDINDLDEGMARVFAFNWDNLHNPFQYAKDGKDENELVKELLNKQAISKEIYAKVKVRGVAQSIFRRLLLEAYGSRCAVCGSKIPILLEAAHIVPWSKCNDHEKLDVTNGILLCSNHHKLFDGGLITIDQDYVIRVNSTIKLKSNGRKLRLPIDKSLRPSKEFLLRRIEQV
ncbi:HNH endonuclease [Aquibacillus kalidii]|uniref:HNH endonuclease n=1 Tax=Aquibacillus kalidii TaxID=2762597 RepID=UPI001645227B|nr:HNH endonuclease signature motif containing protein [Aquibacillus kalidii]